MQWEISLPEVTVSSSSSCQAGNDGLNDNYSYQTWKLD
jgi:hypothetical protein